VVLKGDIALAEKELLAKIKWQQVFCTTGLIKYNFC